MCMVFLSVFWPKQNVENRFSGQKNINHDFTTTIIVEICGEAMTRRLVVIFFQKH